jgi:hypothetical protein
MEALLSGSFTRSTTISRSSLWRGLSRPADSFAPLFHTPLAVEHGQEARILALIDVAADVECLALRSQIDISHDADDELAGALGARVVRLKLAQNTLAGKVR